MILQKENENTIEGKCKQENANSKNTSTQTLLKIKKRQRKIPWTHNEEYDCGKLPSPSTVHVDEKRDRRNSQSLTRRACIKVWWNKRAVAALAFMETAMNHTR